MAAGEIRDLERLAAPAPDWPARDSHPHPAPDRVRVVTVLPPREGFSPDAVGAIGLLVHRLSDPDDIIVGQMSGALTFSGRRFIPAEPPVWPLFGRVDRYMAGVVRTVRKLAPRIVEVHNRASLALRLARALPEASIVLFVHNDPQAMRQARRPVDRAALLRRLHVVCVSRYLHARFMDGLDPAGPAPTVLRNALDLAALPARLPAADREPTVLFAGRVVANKGADSFVQACSQILPRLPGWRAVMIGADRFAPHGQPSEFERLLQPLARQAGIEQLGYQPHAAMMQAMARAAIVVVPSRWQEPFGLTALEAMASGAALICSRRGGLPEVAGEAALYADPDEPGALAAAILRLAQDAALRARLAEAGLIRARGFDAPAARRQLAELRARLLPP